MTSASPGHQPDGRVVVGGYTRVADQEAPSSSATTSSALGRASFGTGGSHPSAWACRTRPGPDRPARRQDRHHRGPARPQHAGRIRRRDARRVVQRLNGTLHEHVHRPGQANGIRSPPPNTLTAVSMHDDGRGFALAGVRGDHPVTLKRFAVSRPGVRGRSCDVRASTWAHPPSARLEADRRAGKHAGWRASAHNGMFTLLPRAWWMGPTFSLSVCLRCG